MSVNAQLHVTCYYKMLRNVMFETCIRVSLKIIMCCRVIRPMIFIINMGMTAARSNKHKHVKLVNLITGKCTNNVNKHNDYLN